MKRFLILNIILFLSLACVSQVYETSNNRARRIGYTTNYGYSGFQSTSSTLHVTMPNYTNYTGSSRISGMSVRYTNYVNKSSPYIPGSTSVPGASRSRRITVYNGNGETAETPGGNDDPEGIYRYDEVTNKWYYSPDNGITWYEWRKAEGFWERFTGLISSIFGGGGTGNDWRPYRGTDENLENSSKWASDPDDPFLEPIGDYPIELLVLLILGYVYYRKRKTVSV